MALSDHFLTHFWPKNDQGKPIGRYRLRETHMLHPVQLKDPSPFATFGPEGPEKSLEPA